MFAYLTLTWAAMKGSLACPFSGCLVFGNGQQRVTRFASLAVHLLHAFKWLVLMVLLFSCKSELLMTGIQ